MVSVVDNNIRRRLSFIVNIVPQQPASSPQITLVPKARQAQDKPVEWWILGTTELTCLLFLARSGNLYIMRSRLVSLLLLIFLTYPLSLYLCTFYLCAYLRILPTSHTLAIAHASLPLLWPLRAFLASTFQSLLPRNLISSTENHLSNQSPFAQS